MINAILDDALAPLAAGGLVLFVLVFVGVAVWVLSRSRQTIDTWASLPLADGMQPVQPRGNGGGLPILAEPSLAGDGAEEKNHSCGKCEKCNC
ncbi:MAG: hypothetical protein AAGJ46_08740 [Planctomycetota bacterium]